MDPATEQQPSIDAADVGSRSSTPSSLLRTTDIESVLEPTRILLRGKSQQCLQAWRNLFEHVNKSNPDLQALNHRLQVSRNGQPILTSIRNKCSRLEREVEVVEFRKGQLSQVMSGATMLNIFTTARLEHMTIEPPLDPLTEELKKQSLR
jgi:hypothetical protein